MFTVTEEDTRRIEEKMREMVAGRSGSCCPSEVVRSLAQADELAHHDWRKYMDAARHAAYSLRDRGELDVLQKGDKITVAKGPIRIQRALP